MEVCLIGVLAPSVFLYLKSIVKVGSTAEHIIIGQVSKVEFDFLTLGSFLRYFWYGPVARLAYPLMVSGGE